MTKKTLDELDAILSAYEDEVMRADDKTVLADGVDPERVKSLIAAAIKSSATPTSTPRRRRRVQKNYRVVANAPSRHEPVRAAFGRPVKDDDDGADDER